MARRKRYAQVGLGGRSLMYVEALLKDFADGSELVGLCDFNEGRVGQMQRFAAGLGANVAGYGAKDFDRMIGETRPDCVIVTTKDCHHDEYICRSMELGCDVITEKPMTIDERRCRRIIEARKRTGRKCTVTFNYRYSPPRTQIKDLLMSGVIGEVFSVDFHWMLDTSHGADYFRRWHRNKANSGGLLVHKATHHFDLVNWWLSTVPETVFAMGQRRFYTARTADRYGLARRGERCHGCPESARCPFFLDLAANEGLRELYLDNEKYDGYFRDRCVFSPLIDIEDTMNVLISYKNGVKMAYSLNAFMPWEGYVVTFNGSKGRLEHKCQESVYINADGSVPGTLLSEGTWVRVFPHFKPCYSIDVWQAVGGHGGGDTLLLQDIFKPDSEPDKYLRAADERGGAYSILCGAAANKSMATGQVVRIDDLVQGIGLPDYPPMPSPDELLPTAKGR